MKRPLIHSCEEVLELSLTRVVKSISSEEEVWRDSMIPRLAHTPSGFLVEEQLEALNPPQRGLGVTGKSSTPREKLLVSSVISFTHLHTSNLL